jgi:hypothetical protein
LRCECRDSGRYLGDHSIYQVTRFWNIVNETYRLTDRYVGSFEIAGLRSFLNLQKFVRVHTRELTFVALPFFNEFVLPTCVASRPRSLSHDVIANVCSRKEGRPHWLTAQAILAASLWNLGSEDEARLTVKKMLADHPNLTASRWAQGLPYRHETDLSRMPQTGN